MLKERERGDYQDTLPFHEEKIHIHFKEGNLATSVVADLSMWKESQKSFYYIFLLKETLRRWLVSYWNYLSSKIQKVHH